ncbi:MAG: DUF5652 family protein [Patescibacteria group bacterium]
MDYHISTVSLWGIVALALWDLVWKGLALWRASKKNQKGWFIAIIIINSAGILPIAYLLLTDAEKD